MWGLDEGPSQWSASHIIFFSSPNSLLDEMLLKYTHSKYQVIRKISIPQRLCFKPFINYKKNDAKLHQSPLNYFCVTD